MKSLSRTSRDSASSSSSSSLTPGVDVDVPVFTLQYNDGQGDDKVFFLAQNMQEDEIYGDK